MHKYDEYREDLRVDLGAVTDETKGPLGPFDDHEQGRQLAPTGLSDE